MNAVIIIPTYNERENILKILDMLHAVARSIVGYKISFLVVDDTSPDGTKDAVLAYKKKHHDVHIITGEKQGLGNALLRGMTYACETLGADIVVQIDADLSHDPKKVPLFFQAIDNGADFVVGSRYIKGGSIPENWGIHRKIYSIIGNTVVRFGLGHTVIHDWTGGFRAYKKIYFERNRESMKEFNGYVFQIAFLHKSIHEGANVVEIPFHFSDRQYGHSKIAPMEYILKIFEYIFRERMREMLSGKFLKFLIVGGIGFIINAVLLVILHDMAHWTATNANLAGAAAAIFSNYNLNNVWTFQERKITSLQSYILKLAEFYVASLFGVIVIQTGTIALGVRFFGDRWYFLSFLIGTGFLLVWNFTVYSKFIWKKRQ